MAKKEKMDSRSTIRKVLQYVRKYWALLICSMVMAVVSVVCSLYLPILIGRSVDQIIGPRQVSFEKLVELFGTMAVLIGLGALSQWLMNAVNNRITYHTVQDVRRDAFAKIQRLPLKYLDSHSTGDIVSRCIADVDQFADGLLMGFTQFFTGVLTIAGTLVFMLTLSPAVTAIVVVLTPLSLFVARFIAKRTYSMFSLQSKTRGEQTVLIDEMIGSQKVVQAFDYQPRAQARFDEVNDRLEKASLKAIFFSSITNPSTRFINSCVYAGVCVTGSILAFHGGLTVGGLTSFLSYANQYTKPFNEISGVITELQNALACAARIFELIEETPENEEILTFDAEKRTTELFESHKKTSGRSSLLEGAEADSVVSLQHVNFSYHPDRPLIEDLNLEVKEGQRIAIVGPTGCGKTTIINLLMRFYDINSGTIRINGKDVRSFSRHELRSIFGMVLQETWLKSGTIRDNIAMGRPEATEEEVIQAAKLSHAHGFIRRLPQGYDTVIREGGEGLSAGQKQLLCIARVMLCLPPMLILDEATSSIDTRTELKIQESFETMMKGRTTFIVAHRLSTIQNADMILVMKDGHILEKGKHEQLLQKGGFYANLYNSQFAGNSI